MNLFHVKEGNSAIMSHIYRFNINGIKCDEECSYLLQGELSLPKFIDTSYIQIKISRKT